MKKIMLMMMIVLLAFLMSCEQPVGVTIYEDPIAEEPEPTNPIIGTFIKNGDAFTFFDNGDFSYYDNQTGFKYNYGFWIDSGNSVYLEDPVQVISITYWYYISGGNLFLSTNDTVYVEWIRE